MKRVSIVAGAAKLIFGPYLPTMVVVDIAVTIVGLIVDLIELKNSSGIIQLNLSDTSGEKDFK